MFVISLSLILIALTGDSHAFKPSGKSVPVNKPYDQKFTDRYSPLKYLGGLGPYSSRSGNGISTDVPAGCEIDQVVLLQRHGERYPSASDAKAQRSVLEKIADSTSGPYTGDLTFLNSWEYFLESEGDAGLEITKGPYAGTADAFEKGSTFFGRYGHLWDKQSGVPFFVSGSERVIQTARSWGRGFAGYNYTDIAEVNVISESPEAGGNSLSPYFCELDEWTECSVPDNTQLNSLYNIAYPEYDEAAIRLNTEHGLHLTAADIFQLFEIASFDVSAHGDSPWLDVFTRDEWNAYEYQKGLWFYCNFGGGSKKGRAFGTNLANATTAVLNQGPGGSGLPLLLNFLHDTDITSFLGGLDILSPLKELRADKVTFDTRWEISDIVPMGAQLTLERLKCRAPDLTNSSDFVSANATLPNSYLNASYGQPVKSNTSYFSPNYKNSTTVSLTNGSVSDSNTTSVYGYNITAGSTDGAELNDSYFVRLLLNEAVVPLDFCYEGPGYSCSLEDWTAHVSAQAAANNYNATCKPESSDVPAYFDFYWNYNQSTSETVTDHINWLGSPLS